MLFIFIIPIAGDFAFAIFAARIVGTGLMAARADIMGPFTIKRRLMVLGWLATVAMAVVVVAMLATWGNWRR